jgi:DNA-binding CsgD family transcriptional regulator
VQAESILEAEVSPNVPMQTIGQRMVWAARAELALARGDAGIALETIDRLISSTANVSEQRGILRLSKLRGEALTVLQREAEAETVLQSAQSLATALGAQPMQWRIYMALGSLYQTQIRQKESEAAFSAARTIIEELADTIPDRDLQEHFLRKASTMLLRKRSIFSPRRAARQAFGGLTEREREVAALIARGKSNREIAEELVVSYRTVETHISTVLSKLGFSSRAQIAVWAVEVGLLKGECAGRQLAYGGLC